ncbi:hypothetical protein DFJ73DRAFT_759408 [Zopfochytrium polystomum]|nr:hypothetical protein DFJ73DRAFT_759408 [Zopfochytrium polystomum]
MVSIAGFLGIVRLLVQREPRCIAQPYTAVVEFLVAKGADVNLKSKTGASPLYTACANEEADVVRFQLEHGATVECDDLRNSHSLLPSGAGRLDIVQLPAVVELVLHRELAFPGDEVEDDDEGKPPQLRTRRSAPLQDTGEWM